jgi:hypothetical protein
MRILIALGVAIVSLASQQPDVSLLGPAVGASAPGFELTDQNGRMRTLDTVAGPQGTMLVFFRSADW